MGALKEQWEMLKEMKSDSEPSYLHLKDYNGNITLSNLIGELLQFVEKERKFPDDISMSLRDYLNFSRLFKDGELEGNLKEGYKFSGITVGYRL